MTPPTSKHPRSHITLLALLVALTGIVTDSHGQFRQIDLGSTETIEVHAFGDPLSFIRIPPGAFGDFPPETFAWIGIDIPTCNGRYCLGGVSYAVSFDDGGCCGGGALVKPVLVQIRYDEEEVLRFGIDEEDVVLASYDPVHRQWVPVPEQTVDVDLNVVSAPENETIRIYVAAFASVPQPVAPTSWGRIKALFRSGATR